MTTNTYGDVIVSIDGKRITEDDLRRILRGEATLAEVDEVKAYPPGGSRVR